MSVKLPESATLTFLVVDDHESVLGGTVSALQREYPQASIQTALHAQTVVTQVEQMKPNLVVMDLSIPNVPGEMARPETGIQLLKTLMERYPTLNIVVQSAHVQALIRLKPEISKHEGGFTIASKDKPLREMLSKVDWALKGVIYTPREMRTGTEVKQDWLDLLHLAFEEGLTDKAIASRMKVADRTVRYYWTQLQNVLEVYPEDGVNMRIHTEQRAREAGLID